MKLLLTIFFVALVISGSHSLLDPLGGILGLVPLVGGRTGLVSVTNVLNNPLSILSGNTLNNAQATTIIDKVLPSGYVYGQRGGYTLGYVRGSSAGYDLDHHLYPYPHYDGGNVRSNDYAHRYGNWYNENYGRYY